MARSRGRSRGSSLPALGGTLGTLLRSTLAQAGVVKDALERGAREGKHRLDDARRERRREQALARLGEAVLDALRAGDAPELLERADVSEAVAEVEDVERGGERERDRDREAWVAPPTRERYDRGDDDGTVASGAWRPPATGRGGVWRPPGVGGEPERGAEPRPRAKAGEGRPPAVEAGAGSGRRPADEPGARFQEPKRPGGIQFDREQDDDDLADFMHPDDLPPRPPKGT